MSVEKKDILLIFDLNKVLVIRKPMSSQYVLRPFVKEFLKYMSSRFKIAIWTSARKANVLDIINNLFVSNNISLEFEWYQGRCTKVLNKTIKAKNERGEDRPVLVKKLSVVWKEFPNYHRGNTVRNNTFIYIYWYYIHVELMYCFSIYIFVYLYMY